MLNDSNSLTTKRGYLKGDFLFSHIKDQKYTEYELHYHEFNKIIIFISGNVTYLIEGKAYKLKPWDILFVSSNEIHMPVIDPNQPYERIGIWVNSKFLEKYSTQESNLFTCFQITSKHKFNLLRMNISMLKKLKEKLAELEDAYKNESFGSQVLKNSLALELIIYFNRLVLENDNIKKHVEIQNDKSIDSILSFINDNLNSDLSIDKLSKVFYVSRYYLMHKFKMNTGYTVHNYIIQKRLIMANSLMMKGKTLTEACAESGFGDYSSFVRAFKNAYGLSPSKHYNSLLNMEKSRMNT
ncbi:MAG: AraC-family transcriptional regulator [Clostridiales bacterium]|jgi:AraC-like DNA-binding protein|nr:AraC-family transcriptional regulator [Clostridiales bacterium]